ncbi:MAG TPA: hypothetical protein VF081_09010 [Solirubrobacterales bacterium]
MTRLKARHGVLLALALGAIALFAVSGIATAKHRNHHRSPDGQERQIATIASFDAATGRLTIALGGEEFSGLVTNRTKIKCEDEHSPDIPSRHRHGESEPGDDNGGHGDERGDNDGHDDEPGEDHQGDNSGPGSENSGPSGHDDNGTGADCTTSDLIPGAVVEEADLEIRHGTATFDEVELAH